MNIPAVSPGPVLTSCCGAAVGVTDALVVVTVGVTGVGAGGASAALTVTDAWQMAGETVLLAVEAFTFWVELSVALLPELSLTATLPVPLMALAVVVAVVPLVNSRVAFMV